MIRKGILCLLNRGVTAIRLNHHLKLSLLVLMCGSFGGLLCYLLSLTTLDDFIYYTPFVLFPFFVFVSFYCDRQYKISSFILFAYFLICVVFTNPELQIGTSYIKACYIALLIEAAATLAMLTSNIFERNGKYYCLVFLFAAFIHFMVISSLEHESYQGEMSIGLAMQLYGTALIYYNELILTVYIMIMAISINGIHTAVTNFCRFLVNVVRRVQGILLYIRVNNSSLLQISFLSKRNKR